MEFRVQPEVLQQQGREMSRLAADVDHATAYTSTWFTLGLGDSGEVFRYVLPAVDSVREGLEEMLARVQQLGTASAAELGAAAALYRGKDDEASSRLDAAYPGR